MSTRHIRFLCGQRTLLSSLNTSAPVHVRGRCPASTTAAVHESSNPSAQRTHQSEDLKPFSAIPGPKPLPLLRNLLQFKRNSSRLNPYLEECYNKYGEIFKLEAPGSNNFVYLADPCCLENILRAEGKYPRRDINMTPNAEWLLTDMGYPVTIGFRSGEDWKKARSAINTQIKPSNVQVFTPGLNGVAIRFTDYLKSARDEDNRISDITKLLQRLLVEMSAKFIYNTDVDALVNPTEETDCFIEGVTLQFDCYSRLVVDPPIYKIYHNKLYRDFRKAYKIMKDYSLKHARMVEEMFKTGVENEVQGLLERWLRGGKMTDAEAMMASIDMFGAGVDTTSNQAAFLLYYMAKNPEAQEKLYQEIQSVLGDCTEPTPEDISKMPYLKGCMMESFRMQSTAEINIRVLAEDTALMGYHIPAETNFVYLNFLTAKNEQYFPNPERFDPARWARDKPNPFAVLPFGFGPRSCYGRRFAELELKLILLQVTRQFILGTELEKLEVEYSLLTRPAGNLPFYLKDRY